MNTNKKYLLLSLVTLVAVSAMSFGSIGFAQTVTPLTCSNASSSVIANQVATLTATGGTGTYFWSGLNLNVTNSAGSQFAVSYPSVGVYTVNVSSGSQTASCTVNVVASTSTGNLVCSPAVQSVALGQTATFSATGGNGAYTWSAPDLTIANPNGSGFSASYATAGLKTLTVTSGSLATTCAVNVLANAYTIPTFPNTGEGFGE